MQAVNDPDTAIPTPPPVPVLTFSPACQFADYDSIPDIEDVARLPPDDALLPDLEDYFTTGPGSWGPATLPAKNFPGFKPPAIGSSKGGPVNSLVGSSEVSPKRSPNGSSPNSSSILQPGLLPANAIQGNPAMDKTQHHSDGQSKDDAWELIELVEAESEPRCLLEGLAVREAGAHQGHGQGHQEGGSQGSSLCEQSMPAAMQDFDAGLEASMAAWLPQESPPEPPKHLLNSAHASGDPSRVTLVSDSVPLPSAGQLGDILHPFSLAAVASPSEALADWMEVSLIDKHEPSASQGDDDTKALQSAGSSRKLLQYSSGSAEDSTDGRNNSPRIQARLSGGQKPRWDSWGDWSAQVSTRGRQLTHQLSDKGKQLVEQAQSSVATAVAEVRQAQAGQVAVRGSMALQQASQQLQPHVSAGAAAVMQDMQVMTVEAKYAAADLANKAKNWWQRRSSA